MARPLARRGVAARQAGLATLQRWAVYLPQGAVMSRSPQPECGIDLDISPQDAHLTVEAMLATAPPAFRDWLRLRMSGKPCRENDQYEEWREAMIRAIGLWYCQHWNGPSFLPPWNAE